jgi:hypothetical protein
MQKDEGAEASLRREGTIMHDRHVGFRILNQDHSGDLSREQDVIQYPGGQGIAEVIASVIARSLSSASRTLPEA